MRGMSRLALLEPPLLSRQMGCVAAWHAGGLYGPSLTSDGKLRDFISNTHHGQFGSTSGADSNDPLQLIPYQGKPYLYQTGVSGNYASVPDAANLRLTGDLRIEGLLTADTSVLTSIAGKYASSTQGYVLRVESGGALRFQWYDSGTSAARTLTSSVAVTFGAAPIWCAVDFDADDGAGNCAATFYTSSDGVSWSQLGTVRTSGTTAAIATGSEVFTAGAYGLGTSAVLIGPLHKVRLYNQIGGVAGKVLDIDFTDPTAYNATRTSLTAVTGQTVTINRSSSGRKASVVDRPLILFGTDDYIEVADADALDFVAGQSFTTVIAMRYFGTAGGNGVFMGKKADGAAGSVGWLMELPTGTATMRGRMADGSKQTTVSAVTFTSGATSVLAMRSDRRTAQNFVNGSLLASVTDVAGSLSNSLPVVIGANSNKNGLFADLEFLAAAIFRRALTDYEVRQINRELIGVPV